MGGNISRDPPNTHAYQQHHHQHHHHHRHNSNSSPSSIKARKSKSSTLRNSKSNSVNEEKKIPVKSDKRIIYGRTYHAIESSSYMLPKDDKEIDRLHEEHFVTKELLGL